MPHLSPRISAYLVAAFIALSLSYDLLRMPIQVSDSLVELLDVQESPSLYATFASNAQQSAYLRPLRLVQIKALFDVSDGHYWQVYRGFHALLLIAAVVLFTRALQVRTWADFAASAFALTVLTGLHTFRGTVAEAYPINHFLEMVVMCLVALTLAQSRGGWWIDAAAAVTFIVASLTLESGLLVWVVATAAWASGMRGISRRGVVVMTALLGAYLCVRFFVLSVGTPGLSERSAGFLLRVLEPEELEARFGSNPFWFYAYNVGASMMSVLFSEPQSGVFESARRWLQGDVPPRVYVGIVSSVLTTAGILWVAGSRLFGGRRDVTPRDVQFLIIFTAVLVANAVLSYAYTKDETVSVAGAFYAFAAFAAARGVLDVLREPLGPVPRFALCLLLVATASVWAFRSAGVHHMLQVQAFSQRNDWARIEPGRLSELGYPSDARARALTMQLRQSALELRIANPHVAPRWADRWWGQ